MPDKGFGNQMPTDKTPVKSFPPFPVRRPCRRAWARTVGIRQGWVPSAAEGTRLPNRRLTVYVVIEDGCRRE